MTLMLVMKLTEFNETEIVGREIKRIETEIHCSV